MLLYDPLAHPQAETCASKFLRRLKRLKQLLLNRRIDSVARVGNDNLDAVRLESMMVLWCDPKQNTTAGAHRVKCISYQVVDDLANLAFHAMHGRTSSAVPLDLDLSDHKPTCVQSYHTPHNVGDVHANSPALLTMEAQRLKGNLRNSRQLALRDVGILVDLSNRLRLPNQIQKICDRLQGVVDFVRYGRCKLTDGGQLLGAA